LATEWRGAANLDICIPNRLARYRSFKSRKMRCLYIMPDGREVMTLRNALYAMVLLLCGCSRLSQTKSETLQLGRLTSGLQQVWPGRYPVQMRVTVKGSAGHEWLHCQLFNRSGDTLQLNQFELPWVTPGLFDVAALNSVGRVVTRTGFISVLTNGWRAISLGAGQGIAGDIPLKSILPGGSISRDQDLLLIWSYSVEMFGSQKAIFETGVIFLPKMHFGTP
jgi:hypothetical protein